MCNVQYSLSQGGELNFPGRVMLFFMFFAGGRRERAVEELGGGSRPRFIQSWPCLSTRNPLPLLPPTAPRPMRREGPLRCRNSYLLFSAVFLK